jgi:hypothetical protein
MCLRKWDEQASEPALSDPDISPLDYLLGIVRDANESSEPLRNAALAAAAFSPGFDPLGIVIFRRLITWRCRLR